MPAKNSTLILSIGGNERLLLTRNLVLESEGWSVVATTKHDDAMGLFSRQDFDAVVLGHSIPAKERTQLAQQMKSLRADIPVIMVCVQGDSAFSSKIADARVGSLDGPGVLIGAVRRLVDRKKQI